MMSKGNGRGPLDDAIPAMIPISEMVIDEQYQRNVSQKFVDRIAKEWRSDAAGSVILNLREDNTYAVLDGQHRVRAASQAGIMELAAHVFVGKSKEEEARLFVQLNTKIHPSPMALFRANLRAGSSAEKNIRHALRELDLDIALHGPGRDKVQCAGALLRIYHDYGLAQFKLIAGTLQSAFCKYPDSSRGYIGPAFKGLAAFLQRYPDADIKRVIAKLQETGPVTMIGLMYGEKKAGVELEAAWGRALTELYNTGLSRGKRLDTRLWDKKLFTPRGKKVVSETTGKRNAQLPKDVASERVRKAWRSRLSRQGQAAQQ